MVAEHALRQSPIDQFAHALHDGNAVGAAIAEVSDEDQPMPGRMASVGVVTQRRQQVVQCIDFAVDVAHDIEWTLHELADQPSFLDSRDCAHWPASS